MNVYHMTTIKAYSYLLKSITLFPILLRFRNFLSVLNNVLGREHPESFRFLWSSCRSKTFENQCLKWINTLYKGTVSKLEIPVQKDSLFTSSSPSSNLKKKRQILSNWYYIALLKFCILWNQYLNIPKKKVNRTLGTAMIWQNSVHRN